MENLKKTALYDSHKEWGGKLIEFAGWMLPVEYGGGIIEEHEAVRNAAGLFDVSHMGEIEVKGPEAFEFIQYLITNDIEILKDNQVVYTFMCYPYGGVVDDLLVYKFSNERFLLVVNASNINKDYQWILKNSGEFNVDIVDISEKVSEVALQGPKAEEILQKLTETDLKEIKFFELKEDVKIDGKKSLVSRTGYTGEDGFEIYTENKNIKAIWDIILKVGGDMGAKPAGLGARDTLRFEAALPLYGNELSENITPLEAGLGFFVKLNKKDFIGKEVLVGQKSEGLTRKIVGFEMVDRGIPRHGYDVYSGDKKIGVVTTGYMSPTLKKNIGVAMVDIAYAELGTEISIIIRNKALKAKVVNKKFYTKKYKKDI